jgi:hypothetical protein
VSLHHLSLLGRLRHLTLVGAAGTVAGTAAIVAVVQSAGAPEPQPSVQGRQLVKGDDDQPAARSFLVSGDVTDLAPGVTRPLRLRLTNPNHSDISVEAVQVTVGNSSTGCSGGSLRVAALPGPVFVPRLGEAGVTLGVTMSASALSICDGASFPLTYGGSAVKA